jgi:hypothetical protein
VKTETVRWSLITLLIIVWLVNISVPIFNQQYKSQPEIHATMMAIIGALLAWRPKNGGDPPS